MKRGPSNPSRLPLPPPPRPALPSEERGGPSPESVTVPIPILGSSEFEQLEARQDVGSTQYSQLKYPLENGSLEIALGYRRCFDFDPTNSRGQDSLLLRVSPGKIVGIVADGVSQSFFGDIAARGLSRGLMKHLWESGEVPPMVETVQEALFRLEPEIAREVEQYVLPKHLPEMQLQALDRARSRGSQAVFAAFVLYPRERLLALYQAGDVSAIISGDVPPLECDPRGRWSSAGSNRLLLASQIVPDCGGILLKTDGAGEAWGKVASLAALNAAAFAELAHEQASKDDVCFLSVQYGAGSKSIKPSGGVIHQPAVRYASPIEPPPRKGQIIDTVARTAAPSPQSVPKDLGRPVDPAAPLSEEPGKEKVSFLSTLAGFAAALIGFGFLYLYFPPIGLPPPQSFLPAFMTPVTSSAPRNGSDKIPAEQLAVLLEPYREPPPHCEPGDGSSMPDVNPSRDSAILCFRIVQKNITRVQIKDGERATFFLVPANESRTVFNDVQQVYPGPSNQVRLIASTAQGKLESTVMIQPNSWYVVTLGKEN